MKRVFPLLLALSLLLIFSSQALALESDCDQMLINKTYILNQDYVPDNLVYLSNYTSASGGVMMTQEAAEALAKMFGAAKEAGVTSINGASGYRSYSTQRTLNNRKISYYRNLGYGTEEATALAGTVVAPPGASEHQSGMAIDITTSENSSSLTGSFANTKAGKWLAENCWKYGFILRYPTDKTEITGYIYEPWHFRYVGVPHAEYMTKNNLCLEEYITLLQTEGQIGYLASSGLYYQIYYREVGSSASLEGYVVNISQALSGGGGYLITMWPPLYDMVGRWSEAAVRSLVNLGIIQGYADGSFGPTRNVNRAELVTLLSRTYTLLFPEESAAMDAIVEETEQIFADVPEEAYYYAPVQKMYFAGLLAETMVREENNKVYFEGGSDVLRREVARCLSPLFAALPAITSSGHILQDMQTEDPELQAAVQLLVDYGIVMGDNYGSFNPNDKITREELAAMLYRMMEYYQNEDTADADPEP